MSGGNLVVLGAGNMAEALVSRVLDAGLLDADGIVVTDVRPERIEHFRARFGVRAGSDNAAAVASAAIVVLAVKPQNMADLLAGLAGRVPECALVVSIAAGVRTRRIEDGLGGEARVARVMPNTPALLGCGASAYCLGRRATEADAAAVERLFGAVGRVVRQSESLMDAVTAVSGSGPAYVFYLAEMMERAAVEMGIEPAIARLLTAATIEGAGRMLAQPGADPSELRARVASKGGTTEAAFRVLERAGVAEAFTDAVKAARARAAELSG